MKVATYTNNNGKLCTVDFDPDQDEFDAEAEARREMSEQEALDDYMYNYFDDPDALYDRHNPLDYAPLYDDPWDVLGPLYLDE